ncbi:hypothetical protein [Actinomycetospora chiangmaiensis]|uniref:hypothetical protein n=1 Tax=Actinomycetospora chiangmaiensis TaxID=402650 RepID=UPI00037F7E68|nr:hypothetical protein [Actinomycetospora chiangmaiensis]
MSEGFDADLPVMRMAASGLHGDAGTIEATARSGTDALVSAGAAAGIGPLEGVASALSAQLSAALASVRLDVEDSAAALDAASGTYQSSDAAASRTIRLPGF